MHCLRGHYQQHHCCEIEQDYISKQTESWDLQGFVDFLKYKHKVDSQQSKAQVGHQLSMVKLPETSVGIQIRMCFE